MWGIGRGIKTQLSVRKFRPGVAAATAAGCGRVRAQPRELRACSLAFGPRRIRILLMRSKLKDFLEFLSLNGTEHPADEVSYNGTSTVSSKEIEDALFKRFEEMSRAAASPAATVDPDHP
jgi:hypothetical protein